MEAVIQGIDQLFLAVQHRPTDRIEKLPQSGSDRIYFRLYAGDETFIATYNLNQKETHTFIEFSRHFKNAGLPVPEILGVNADNTIYIQEDLGTESLLNQLEQHGHTDQPYQLFQKSLAALARIQIVNDKVFDYNLCLTTHKFAKLTILSNLS